MNKLVDNMDMPSMLSWAETCKREYERVQVELEASMFNIIAPFMNPVRFMQIFLPSPGAIITGEAALAFVLRDHSLLTDTLEVTVGGGGLDGYDAASQAGAVLSTELVHSYGTNERCRMTGASTVLYRTKTGRFLRVVTSRTRSAMGNLAYYPNTAMMCYLGEYSFGVVYAFYTLRRLGFSRFKSPWEDRQERLLDHGFRFDTSPMRLLNPNLPARVNGEEGFMEETYPCLQGYFACPHQTRYVGDAGTFVGFFRRRQLSLKHLYEHEKPPFGPAAAWGLMTGVGSCEARCWEGSTLFGEQEPVHGEGHAVDVVLTGEMVQGGMRFKGIEEMYRGETVSAWRHDLRRTLMAHAESAWVERF